MAKGNLYVVSGPSGSGKSTVCTKVSQNDNIYLSISATTRAPRGHEKHGVEYFFLSQEEFLQRVANGEFLEHAEVFGNYYGTLKTVIDEKLAKGIDVILEIDVQGGMQVRDKYPEAHLIFFKPPTREELENRLRKRKTESEDKVQQRLATAIQELEYESKYDETIVNVSIEQACKDLLDIIKKNRVK